MKNRTADMKTRSLALSPFALVLVVACNGDGTSVPRDGVTGNTAPLVAEALLTSDIVARPLPNPNPTVVIDWAPLPDGRVWSPTAGIDIGPDGHVWAYDRCGGGPDGGCEANLDVDPILKFDRNTGEVLVSMGAGLFVAPHGLHADSDGNIWVTDYQANEAGTKGHQVIKLSPDGEVLLRLGEAGVAGSGPGQLNQPCDVVTAQNGDIFVSDGHSGESANPPPGSTARILKFDSEGGFIKEWGEIGWAPGQFRTPHALEIDSQGRLFVADRGNARIQIFDQDGNHLDSYEQFSLSSGLFITPDDMLYSVDGTSRMENHPGWKNGVRIGHASEDRLTGFIPPHPHEERVAQGVAGGGVAVDADGNVYTAEGPASRPVTGSGITKFVKR